MIKNKIKLLSLLFVDLFVLSVFVVSCLPFYDTKGEGFYTLQEAPSIENLIDTDITPGGPSVDDILQYDGTNWINTSLSIASGNIASGTEAGQIAIWSGTQWGATSSIIINPQGNIGVGTSAPVYTLDVNGTLRSTGALKIGAYTLPNTDGASAGYVLKTDAMGNITWQEDSTTGEQIFLYYNNTSTDVASYEVLQTFPAGGAEQVDTATSVASSYGLIDSYISSTTDITFSVISAGTWQFHDFININSNVGSSYIVHNIYARNGAGTERLLYQATSTELTTGAKEYQFLYTFASSTLTNERLVIKNYCWTDSIVEKTCTFYYDGNDRYSHVITPLSNTNLGYTRALINETITGNWNFIGSTTAADLTVTKSALGTIVSGVWNGTAIDISSYTNLGVTATGLELSGDNIALTSGYEIPTTASNTDRTQAYDFGGCGWKFNLYATSSRYTKTATGTIYLPGMPADGTAKRIWCQTDTGTSSVTVLGETLLCGSVAATTDDGTIANPDLTSYTQTTLQFLNNFSGTPAQTTVGIKCTWD